MKRIFLAVCVWTVALAADVWACPMCATAVGEGQNQALPKAFYYSILFMLSMPFLLLAAFGTAFYRLSRMDAKQTEQNTDTPVE